ncbi:MAG: hypothetical protein RL095_1246 [Verrucomicrobiota bacterium]|jgi:type 1 glutamine amidotransferase
MKLLSILFFNFSLALAAEETTAPTPKKILFIAGKPSHGYGAHDFKAGCHLFADLLNQSGLPVKAEVSYPGWPKDAKTLEGVDAIVVYADGGAGNLLLPHLKELDALAAKGLGVGMMHYCVECPKGNSSDQFLRLTGGFYEIQHSCNPMWSPEFKSFPVHPVTRGVSPFSTRDEWYMNLRFAPEAKPLLRAAPSDAVRNGPYVWPAGPYKHVQAAKGQEETLMWALERPGGGRGFGFTGGHVHWNWGQPQQRTLILNAAVWLAKLEVPAAGVPSRKLSFADLDRNHDEAKPAQFDVAAIELRLDEWQKH